MRGSVDTKCKKPHVLTAKGKAQLATILRKVDELGLKSPWSDTDLDLLYSSILPDMRALIEDSSRREGFSQEEVARAYIRSVLDAEEHERLFHRN